MKNFPVNQTKYKLPKKWNNIKHTHKNTLKIKLNKKLTYKTAEMPLYTKLKLIKGSILTYDLKLTVKNSS